MSHIRTQLRFLLPLAVVALATSSANAGFVSMGDESHQSLTNLETEVVGVAASSQSNDEEAPEKPHFFKALELDDLHVGNLPSGGMSSGGSSTSSGGSSVPAAAFLHVMILPSEGPVSPLYLREIPFTPQLMIADIFRPPCA